MLIEYFLKMFYSVAKKKKHYDSCVLDHTWNGNFACDLVTVPCILLITSVSK